ncbi:hypothetical protein NUW58_g2096 [Xylaria curta]|uniref:Uncharacterized protein n=2 Tax=Xylaria curta TaxID=42375 RepID=A0ACC1PH66_9PEZI|nr:hypothetical protein NUW58_g3299 [Xylaria curta]KAJ2992651.1 hypothetical protein NUW58_g2096 [Xylaria curta]
MLNVLSISILFLASASSALRVDPLVARAPEIRAVSDILGIQSPNFTDINSMWTTSFQKKDSEGNLWNVQLPRVLTNNEYNAAESARLFVERFAGNNDEWKLNAQQVSASPAAERQFAAYLKLKHCGWDNTCTPFELSYNANGCHYAPYTEWIEVFYSTNAAFVTWSHKHCTGGHTLWATTCNAGQQDVRFNTPKTRSITYVVGCTYHF